jgi:hypothetical protein
VWALGRCGNSLRGSVIGEDGGEYGEQYTSQIVPRWSDVS